MARKPKFRPMITRVKLNPEQAVLACTCLEGRVQTFVGSGGPYSGWTFNTPPMNVCGNNGKLTNVGAMKAGPGSFDALPAANLS